MANRKTNDSDVCLPFAALQLLAPPVRLVSAALWKVLKQRDVMQYGVVEEFVTSACENIPGLLTLRHQGKLALGLRARLILELCRTQPDAKVIAPHLERIRVPAAPSCSSASTMRKDVKILRTVESFHSFVDALLKGPTERERFFREQFLVDYGPTFDQELEKLLWEFLLRLDQLLPVPNLAQTVSWLSDAPPVLEECAQAATQPQLLKILLQHQTCLGHLESAASLPPNMGDSILASLSLPLSGKVASNQPTGDGKASAELLNGTHPRDKTPFIKPVIGLILNEDVPAVRGALRDDKASNSEDAASEQLGPKEDQKFTVVKQRPKPKDDEGKGGREQPEEQLDSLNRSRGRKRKQASATESESEEEEVSTVARAGGKKTSMCGKAEGHQRTDEGEEGGAERTEGSDGELLTSYASKLGIGKLNLPEDPSLSSMFVSCLSTQPRVVIEKLPVASDGTSGSRRRATSASTEGRHQNRKPPARKRTNSRPTPEWPGLDDKENRPVLLSEGNSSQQRSNSGDGDDYVADSEDEATKNFKGRLFVKRYYKTKHGTYVPTLREFWRPGMTRRDALPASSKSR
ncbi:TERF1-interacting nuclear factor 2 [Leuresthes tenuis]|uniref:TERF1-interacting nuclear factor 2 n=1 Tax=Leuresthes tenuis TaxID=355514 RepID=UPI003B512E78